ncbi:MAG: TolC family protein [Candidatus Binataceae bacterium]
MRPLSLIRYFLTATVAIATLCATAHGETLTLDQAIQRALAFAPTFASASAQSDLSSAMVREARAPLYPSLSAGSEYMQAPGYSIAVTNGGLSSALLTLNYTAYDFGHQAALARAALYQSQAAQYGIPAARAQIVFDTTVAYYDLQRAREVERELESNAARLRRYVAVIQRERTSGRAIPNDLLKIRTASDNAQLTLANAHSMAARAAATLGSMIGVFDRSDLDVAEVSGLPAEPSGDFSRNPMLLAAERTAASTKAAVQAAIRERYPTVRVSASAGWEGINPPHTFTHNAGAMYDGLVSMPIFDGGLISSHIDQARAKVLAADAQVRQVALDLRRRMTDAALRYQQARNQLALLASAQSTANDAFELTWARFLGGGTVTLLEVLDAYQQAELLRLARPDQDFATRQAAAESALLLGAGQR